MAKKKKGPEDYTRAELVKRAERKGIKYRSRMNKAQLIKALGLGEPGKKAATRAKPGKTSARKAAGKPTKKTASEKKAPAEKKIIKPRKPARLKPAAARSRPPRPERAGAPAGSTAVPAPPLPAPAAAYVDHGPTLPQGYGEDRIAVLVRDPRCVFVYWELGGGGRGRLESEHSPEELAAGVWVLRLSRVPEGRFFDVPVDPGIGNWYLHVEPDSRYQVRIGMVLPSGTFLELAASAEVVTPAETVSDRMDEQWAVAGEEFDKLVERILSGRGGSGSPWSEALRGARSSSGALFSPPGGRS